MKIGPVILVLALAVLAIAALAVVAYAPEEASHSIPRIRNPDGTSSNWAGYAVETSLSSPKSGAVTDVKGSWVVQNANCSGTPTAYSSFWVGIDGYSSGTVEQIGTDSDCSLGSPKYYAWYEMYPKFPVNLNMKISPGDVILAEVKYMGQGNFQLTINDTTTGASFTTTQKSQKAQMSSAEWVAEAPSSSNKILPLANFGTVGFKNAQATISGHTGPISDPAWQMDAITMTTSNGTVKAMPSTLANNGTSFNVTWYHS